MGVINKLSESIRSILNGNDKKKLIENSLIVIIIGVIIIIAGSTFFGGGGKDTKKPPADRDEGNVEAVVKTVSPEDSNDIAREFEKVLSQIEGAGKVTVMITYSSSREIVPALDVSKSSNNTQERDSGGGTRNINQDESESKLVFQDDTGGTKKPIILKEKMPEVKGVVVVAEGAGDIIVRDNLVRAVQVLVDVPIHKIQVFKKDDK